MNLLSNKHFHKVISLLIKGGILTLSIFYIFQKLSDVNFTANISNILPKLNSSYFYTAAILVFFNWGIEAVKWKYLIQKLELISFKTALKSTLSGVTISIFTPNRVGEFAGRVFYLKNADRVKATVISFIGSTLQLAVTIIAGFIALNIYYLQHKNEFFLFNAISANNVLYFLLGMASIIITIIIMYFNENSISRKIKEIMKTYRTKELSNAFSLSILRYFIFSFQYYLVLLAFGIDIGILNAFLLIAITFFVNSAIPTFAITEIAVRGATSVYLFSQVSNDTLSIISASIVLWIINLAIPAIIGGAFIWNLKFFKD
jgi:Lysylphosphatidylglycerol synthase TM region